MRALTAIIIVLMTATFAWSVQSAQISRNAIIPSYVAPEARNQIKAWLLAHPDFRVLDDADCACAADLKDMRTGTRGVWKPNPSYHPYFVIGDFNGDRLLDLAVGVASIADKGKIRVLIINSYESVTSTRDHAFLSQPLDSGQALFFGPPRPRPYLLLLGTFGSEAEAFIPKPGGRYLLQ